MSKLRPWKLEEVRLLNDYGLFKVKERFAVSPRTSIRQRFYIIDLPHFVQVLPITPDNKLVLVRQFRHGQGDFTIEIPGGLLDSKEDPKEAALRELMEETGYVTKEIVYLGETYPQPALISNKAFFFLAKNVILKSNQSLDEGEDIEVVLYDINEVEKSIREGKITHALTITALYLYKNRFPD